MSSINYNIVLIGNSGVGKVAFFRKITQGKFQKKNISTIGADKRTIELEININNKDEIEETKKFQISLFDTEGQERYRAITQNYYKGSGGIILLYDITERQSFDNVEIWIDSIKEAMNIIESKNKFTCILVGNNLDKIKNDGNLRKVTEEEARSKCDKYGLIWGGELSIKDMSYDEIIQIFKGYVKEIYKRVGEHPPKYDQTSKNTTIKKMKKKNCLIF